MESLKMRSSGTITTMHETLGASQLGAAPSWLWLTALLSANRRLECLVRQPTFSPDGAGSVQDASESFIHRGVGRERLCHVWLQKGQI